MLVRQIPIGDPLWTARSHSTDNARVRTDEQLMAAYREGDTAAFDVLYERHRNGLYRFILRQVGHRELAEELYQDVWIRLIDSRRRYRETARFQTYLYRIARNRVIDEYRARKSEPLVAPEAVPDTALAADELVDGQQIADVLEQALAKSLNTAAVRVMQQALAKLPADQRAAVLLRFEGELGLNEIAEIFDCGRETIKSRLRYAFKRLRQMLGDHDELKP